jgi:hypothetical protein
MLHRVLLCTAALALTAATPGSVTGASASSAIRKSPPWISIESPVNPYDATTRGAAMLVHAEFREGSSQLSDLSGTAEGLVAGARRSVPLRFEATSKPDVYALRRQWPGEGAWLLRIALRTTTAVVSLDRAGNVASVRVPTESSQGIPLPRAVPAKEIDTMLADAAKR